MGKNYIALLLLFLLSSCCEKDYFRNLVSIYDLIENERDIQKPSIICFVDNYNDMELIKDNKFYGKYLLAQLFEGMDVVKSQEMYSDLWANSTSKQMNQYPEEFIEILKNKKHLALIATSEVKFDYIEYDFGEISLSEEVECFFYFTNKSDAKLVIHNIITTCGCTVPFWNKQPISSNSRDSICVKFKAGNVGLNQKTILIEGNLNQKIELKIKASVL